MIYPKLIVTDLDGTLLRHDKTISSFSKDIFKKCYDAHIPVAIATARYIYGAKPYSDCIKARYQILTDGTLIFDNKKLIYAGTMSVDTTNKILFFLRQYGFTSHIAIPTKEGLFRYPNNTINTTSMGTSFDINHFFPFPACKIIAEFEDEEIAKYIAKESGCFVFRYNGENRFSFQNVNCNKSNAVKILANHLAISPSDIMVFGDDINDIDMIKNCGYGVAMKNAIDAVKNVANFIADTNENDGVAKTISQFI